MELGENLFCKILTFLIFEITNKLQNQNKNFKLSLNKRRILSKIIFLTSKIKLRRTDVHQQLLVDLLFCRSRK